MHPFRGIDTFFPIITTARRRRVTHFSLLFFVTQDHNNFLEIHISLSRKKQRDFSRIHWKKRFENLILITLKKTSILFGLKKEPVRTILRNVWLIVAEWNRATRVWRFSFFQLQRFCVCSFLESPPGRPVRFSCCYQSVVLTKTSSTPCAPQVSAPLEDNGEIKTWKKTIKRLLVHDRWIVTILFRFVRATAREARGISGIVQEIRSPFFFSLFLFRWPDEYRSRSTAILLRESSIRQS